MSAQDGTGVAETIARLQSVMLESVLLRQPLPGRSEPVWFPDLAWITEAPTILVSDDNVPAHLPIADTDPRVDVVPDADIREAAVRAGDKAYVYFQPPKQTGEQIGIVMEVRIAPAEPELTPLGLGGIAATFVRATEGAWEVREPPAIFGI
jgi:hypothetical protein